jgi:hypothetical protein
VQRQLIEELENMRNETAFFIQATPKLSLGGTQKNRKKSQEDRCPALDENSE